MTRDEYEALAARLHEINVETSRMLPDFLQAGGSQEVARIDARAWRARLYPLFDEHHAIVDKLKDAIIEDD